MEPEAPDYEFDTLVDAACLVASVFHVACGNADDILVLHRVYDRLKARAEVKAAL